jgi:glycosyltransferase involved in cell wall biosynthesis
MMRILMVTEFYPPTIGGIEQHVHNLARALAGRGHQVSVAASAHQGLPAITVEDGVTVHRINGFFSRLSGAYRDQQRRYVPPIPDPGTVSALRAIVRDLQPDVVHAHNWMVHSFLPLKRSSGARLVLSLHDYSLVCAKKSLVFRDDTVCSGPALLKCLRCAGAHYGYSKGVPIVAANNTFSVFEKHRVDLFVPVSNSVADGVGLADHHLPFEVIPNFVPDDVALEASQAEQDFLDRLPPRFFLFVGALGRHKGIQAVLDAHQRMSDAIPLVMLGMPWPDMPTHFPAGVAVMTDVPHARVMAAMARSLAVVIPSIYPDACPTVAIEAMAAGRPVIASRIGGLPDLVADGETGSLVPPGDVDALAHAMTRLQREDLVRERMGRAGPGRVSSLFTASAVVGRLERAYEDAAPQ